MEAIKYLKDKKLLRVFDFYLECEENNGQTLKMVSDKLRYPFSTEVSIIEMLQHFHGWNKSDPDLLLNAYHFLKQVIDYIDATLAINKDVSIVVMLKRNESLKKHLQDAIDETFEKYSNTISRADILRPEFEDRLSKIEEKMNNKINDWKSNKNKIECAAFVEILYINKYLIQDSSRNRQICERFARERYNGINIANQLQSGTKADDRAIHRIKLKKYFE